jgi:hypothetical protein
MDLSDLSSIAMTSRHNRRHPRHLLGAAACIYSGATVVPCVIADVSEAGARVRVPESVVLAARFDLFTSPAQPMQGCQQVWRNGDLLGVRFVA